jgi:tetratricopeptide (TPR) repeat protein
MYRCDLMANYKIQTQFLIHHGRLKEAEEACRRGQDHASKLVTAYPTVSAYRHEFSLIHCALGDICSRKGELQEAEKCFRHSLAQMDRLVSDSPDRLDYRGELKAANTNLAYLLLRTRQFREAVRAFRRWIELTPNDPEPHRELACVLADCSDTTVRDPAQAVKLAQRSLDLAANDRSGWSILGIAFYRAGDWRNAITAVKQGIKLNSGGTTYAGVFVVAMAYWQMGDKKLARWWYDQAAQGMDKQKKPTSELSRRLRVEAATLLGIHEPPTKGKEESP